MSQVTLGGDRLGAGNKQKVNLKNYERSSHDLGYVWRSTMSSGTLVPFMTEVGLPGDNFEINLNVDMKTHPTIGPLFGSYKVQLDVFSCPIRLYNAKLHMNMLNIGLNMSAIKLPQIRLTADGTKLGDNEQLNPSSLFSYLNIRGLGRKDPRAAGDRVTRDFNGIPYLAYWDIYKNYYANKQEEYGAYIHNARVELSNSINTFVLIDENRNNYALYDEISASPVNMSLYNGEAYITCNNSDEPVHSTILINIEDLGSGIVNNYPITQIFTNIVWNAYTQTLECSNVTPYFYSGQLMFNWWVYNGAVTPGDGRPIVNTFPLTNIDEMRQNILEDVYNTGPFMITNGTVAPYGPPITEGDLGYSKLSSQEGLGLKTYQSDLFNNWISTEWIEGENGINQITAVDTSSGEFTLNTLQLSNKVYNMLNRIAVSGGSYDDWLNAVYTHERTRSQENPMYMGGLIRELGFQEVVSNAGAQTDVSTQPLGTLAGKGTLGGKNKGGKIHIRVDEPSYIMGIISLTPKIDYSQGNKWDVNLKTLDDFHKPALDEIGFQDLITDQMAWWDTEIDDGGAINYSSAGKQPAWINYMTNVNQVRGNFAEQNEQMFMTLNRRYEKSVTNQIKDLTTYIDPSKFNNIFADTRLDAQNFWAQIAVDITARRKISARLMPNL